MSTERHNFSHVHPLPTAVCAALVCCVLLPGCVSPTPIEQKTAMQKVIATKINPMWEKADRKLGLRVHQYQQLLPKGTIVQPAFPVSGAKTPSLVCKNPNWLFFIDEMPGAHFAHPAQILLLDAKTGRQRAIKADWWPLIGDKEIFNTVDRRRDRATIIFDKTPVFERKGKKPQQTLEGLTRPLKTHDTCDAWGIIVCGYDDLPDTFDEDTDGIYNVLTGLGLPDNRIFFVSPHTTHAGVDRATSIANVQWAVNQVAAGTDETDKVLFFYSSHGGVDSLSCVPGSAGGGSISAADLDTWLDGITCDELTIIIEACHSGSLIGTYASGTYVATEDDLTGDGETNRCIFTSASSDTSSYPDVDWAGDPNPADTGSETIWGYVEAFSVGAADTNADSEISFGEGWQYAWDNDITRITGTNTPQMRHTGLVANNVYNYCYRVTGDADLFISDGPGDVGHNSYDYCSTDIWVTQDPTETEHQDAVSGMDNLVHVAVHNRGTTPIANVSLKVYWADVSTATSWPGDFHQIGATHLFPSLATGATHTHTWTWYVDPSIGLGHHFCLVGLADSPDDPSTGGPPGVRYVAPYDNNIGQINITIVEDTGHDLVMFPFALKNNTKQAETVDLIVEWVGDPWGTAMLQLPKDLLGLVRAGTIKTSNLKLVEVRGQELPALQIASAAPARLFNIPLKPQEKRIVSVMMRARTWKAGQRHELRLREEVKGKVVGALTAQLRQVDPADCKWVLRNTVEAFADVDQTLRIAAAKKVSELFAKGLSAGICRRKPELLRLLSDAVSLEADVVKAMPETGDAAARKRIDAALRQLNKAVAAKDLRSALKAQGSLSKAVKQFLQR